MKVLQEQPAVERNFFSQDKTLQKILEERLDPVFLKYANKSLYQFGELCANEIDERAKYTDREGEPALFRYNRYGEEVSEVRVNEGYKKTVEETYHTGIVGYVHKEIPELGRKGNYTYSFAQGYLLSHAEPGFYCPVTLTMATAYLLDHYADEKVKSLFLPHVCATGNTELYEGATFLTERQGGSDVGANSVRAEKEDGHCRLYGEKYFASNAGMCGVAMVLARMEGAPAGTKGLTLFAVPWRDEDGNTNGLRIRRLKDKLGVRAVPSGEVEFEGARAYVVGDPAKGFTYMMEALNLSRVCNAVASIGIMRRALLEAQAYAERRNAFGKRLTEFPMVQDTLSKMAARLHVETAAVFDLVNLFEKVASQKADGRDIVLNRLLIAIVKKQTAEQAIHFAHEAIEMHGGNGYIEDFVTPRLLRDAQVLTVWEGTANILGLEVMRLVNKYNAHRLFTEEMQGRLAFISSSAEQVFIQKKLNQFLKDAEEFSAYDEALQTFEVKQLAERMSHLYESIIALEWAMKYGGTYQMKMEIFIEDTWKTRKQGGRMKTAEYFEQLF